MLGHKIIFCILQHNLIRKPLKQSQNISGITTLIGLSCILQIEPTWTPSICWQRRRWTKLFGWSV